MIPADMPGGASPGRSRWRRLGAKKAACILALPIIALALLAATSLAGTASPAQAGNTAQSGPGETCPDRHAGPLLPTDARLCHRLDGEIRAPRGQDPAAYQDTVSRFLGNFCHRDSTAGWVRDKWVRDTGPYISTLTGNRWEGSDFGTHSPVVIWYSPDAADWVRRNRRPGDEGTGPDAEPMPDGAIIVKEMYAAPAALCAAEDPVNLLPSHGAAFMVRDAAGSFDGWYWGWFGWHGWKPDYPADTDKNLPASMGFGQSCVNCHASARDNSTFSASRNLEGEPGRPLVYLVQDRVDLDGPVVRSTHMPPPAPPGVPRLGEPFGSYDPDFLAAFPPAMLRAPVPGWDNVPRMPSQTYDTVWMGPGPPDQHGQFLTADQCAGCHNAGSTGLQYDMTRPAGHDDLLFNISPYATWRGSPMGLAGRDPFFFAQLASETQSFHPDAAALVENTCLGCHGIEGQRQFEIDRVSAGQDCGMFTREMVDATIWPPENPLAALADYGALARDGVSCTTCHQMIVAGSGPAGPAEPQDACLEERQALLTPGLEGFARTFTGSFRVAPAGTIHGPYEDPRTLPMQNALGITPKHYAALQDAEVCGSCHTVHLPVLHRGQVISHIYEQTTYPEWAFSAYRTGRTVDGELPGGAGDRAQTCQGCHMPTTESDGSPTRSRIASIQQYSSFPQADFTSAPEDIDLPVRDHFARHTLVGLNLFLVKLAQQFPDILGIRTADIDLGDRAVPPLKYTEGAILAQARHRTARLSATPEIRDGALHAAVEVENLAGHRFPSGVGFRRAFLTLEVLDRDGGLLWASGRTDRIGRLVDQSGQPLDGEEWWTPDCSARIAPEERRHQPHFQTITRQDQAQIYQELVSAPPQTEPGAPAPVCGHDAEPQGALTTSFLSICAVVKDNRLLPHGLLPLAQRQQIAAALGAGPDLAADVAAKAVGDDPDYVEGGRDRLDYRIALADLDGDPATVRARLHYQATPPFYLQDRFCTAQGKDRDRLYFMAGHLNLEGTAAEGWKLEVADTGPVPVAP